jgi:hypothetical protein
MVIIKRDFSHFSAVRTGIKIIGLNAGEYPPQNHGPNLNLSFARTRPHLWLIFNKNLHVYLLKQNRSDYL